MLFYANMHILLSNRINYLWYFFVEIVENCVNSAFLMIKVQKQSTYCYNSFSLLFSMISTVAKKRK